MHVRSTWPWLSGLAWREGVTLLQALKWDGECSACKNIFAGYNVWKKSYKNRATLVRVFVAYQMRGSKLGKLFKIYIYILVYTKSNSGLERSHI